jgi:hypothetical protein
MGSNFDEFREYGHVVSEEKENARGHVKATCCIDTCKYEADYGCSEDSTNETKEKKCENDKEGEGESGTADVWSWTLDPLFSLVWIGGWMIVGRSYEGERSAGSTGRWEGEIEKCVGAADDIEGNVEYKGPVKSETEDILQVS